MSVENLKTNAIIIESDIEDFLESYVYDPQWGEEQLLEYLKKIENFKREHRRIYSQIKAEVGDTFAKEFPIFFTTKDNLNIKFKIANEKALILKKVKAEKTEQTTLERERLAQETVKWGNEKAALELQKMKLEVEEQESRKDLEIKALCSKYEFEFSNIEEKIRNEIDSYLSRNFDSEGKALSCLEYINSKFEKLDEIYSELVALSSSRLPEFEESRKNLRIQANDFTFKIEKWVDDLKERATKIEQERIKADETEHLSRMMQIASNMFQEIETRFHLLQFKCEIDLAKLSDQESLDLKKREDSFNVEMRELFDRITSLVQYASPISGREASDMIDHVLGMRKISVKTVGDFFIKVNKMISDNDISEKKLNSTANLNIELKKFKGYQSDIDVYTFKNEFEKLIQPNIQKKLLPEYLKKNYLIGSAYTLVEKVEVLEDIWKKLIEAYGNTQLLLQNKVSLLEKYSSFEKLKDDEKILSALSGILNVMADLSKLASTYHLEPYLYYGGGLQRLLKIIGEDRKRKFLKSQCGRLLDEKAKWELLDTFLRKERDQREIFVINDKAEKSLGFDPKKSGSKSESNIFSCSGSDEASSSHDDVLCIICGQHEKHVLTMQNNGSYKIDYFACKTFAEKNTFGRMKLLRKKGLCLKCLSPGMKHGSKHDCDETYICKSEYKDKSGVQRKCVNHVLVCGFHAQETKNVDMFKKFKDEKISKSKTKFESFSHDISISFIARIAGCWSADSKNKGKKMPSEKAIFMFQRIEVGGQKFNVFYDSGCGDLIVTKSAVDKLIQMGRAKQDDKGPLILSGVGDLKSICEHGKFSVKLPLRKGEDAEMSGLCLDKITCDFPEYPLGKVENDFKNQYGRSNKFFCKKLPKLPKAVGGAVDIMIGVQYLKYFPEKVASLKSGLTIYSSMFRNYDQTFGVIAGPHVEFALAERQANFSVVGNTYYSSEVLEYRKSCALQNEVPLLGMKGEIRDSHILDETLKICNSCAKRAPKALKKFDLIENSGTEISFRCVDCRNCIECKKGPLTEEISIHEEVEQQLISQSVEVDFEKRVATSKLPFLHDPDTRLASNKDIALKIYKGQVKKLSSKPQDRQVVLESEAKLQNLGYVDYLDNLSESLRISILESKLLHFIPWRIVWNMNSLTTLLRLVFDGSSKTRSGYSLNDLLAKGSNTMNSLIHILIRWITRLYAFHSDVTKMYNAVRLDPEYWRYQLYLWDQDLDPTKEPKIKVVKTLIYGVKSSGNLAQSALRKVAENMSCDFPKASNVIKMDTYVDDLVSGDDSETGMIDVTDNIKLGLERGGFSLKGFTFSGRSPDKNLSADGVSILVGGLKWFPKEDELSLNLSDINFSQKNRGRKDEESRGKIPQDLTLLNCASRVGELFDPLGRFVPIIAGFKLDLSILHTRTLNWQDKIPDNLRTVWCSNFEMMNEMKNIKFSRAIVPSDAKSLDISTVGFGDAGQKLICAAIYARFEKVDGSFSSQLIFARSKVINEDTSTPRGELMAAVLNSSTGHVVATALGKFHKSTLKLTDSQVVLHWIWSERNVLKTWVRNRVVEINRLSDKSLWRFIESENNLSDIGTRKGAKLHDISEDSAWIKGYSWMSGKMENFPSFSVDEIKLDRKRLEDLSKEKLEKCSDLEPNSFCMVYASYVTRRVSDKVKLRYEFSHYVIDPNRFRFRKVLRILSLVLKFVKMAGKKLPKIVNSKLFTHAFPGKLNDMILSNRDRYLVTTCKKDPLLKCSKVKVVEISEDMLRAAMYYFASKASSELKHFVEPKKFLNISEEIDNVLYYSGRILEDQELCGDPTLCDLALDLSPTKFCVPIMDKHSPVAYAITLDVHWNHPDVRHKGIETLLRQGESIAHIIEGRELVKLVKSGCIRCRILHKEKVKVKMGPIQNVNLCVAPPFYACQADIFGPFKSYSFANKRATIKLWVLIFCCCTTGAIDLRVMDDYSTDSFILAFIRFSCRFGYPKLVLPDEGSQLVKGCKDMTYSFTDVKSKLETEYGVKYVPCPVGAHYVHGKVERKIKQVKDSIVTCIDNERLSVIQWETLMQQIANSINNLPIGVRNKVDQLENIDVITPNRLILGRNNNRCPNAPLLMTNDYKKIIETNGNIFKSWFKAWIISYVPTLIERSKWYDDDPTVKVGDVILFLKSEREYDLQYQYGLVSKVFPGRDGRVRSIEIEYQNSNEKNKRTTKRGVRDVVIIHPVDELDIYHELAEMMM